MPGPPLGRTWIFRLTGSCDSDGVDVNWRIRFLVGGSFSFRLMELIVAYIFFHYKVGFHVYVIEKIWKDILCS